MPLADLTDVRCFYQVTGRGEPVVLIPGLGSTGVVWDTIESDLAQTYCVIRIDNRGIGQSVSKRHPITIRDYSADILELLDYLQIDCVHIVGLSFGGVVAQCFAVQHSSRVSKLVLISSTHEFGPYLREMAKLIGLAMRWLPNPVFVRMMEILSSGPLFFDAHSKDITPPDYRVGVSGRAVARQLRALGAIKFKPGEFQINASTLAISGAYDSLIPHCYARQMEKVIDDCQFILLPEAGHNPIRECPDVVLAMILEFLRSGKVDLDEQHIAANQDKVVA